MTRDDIAAQLTPRYIPLMDNRKHLPPLAKLALDIGPLILFFVVNGRWGIYAATGVFMVAVIVALVVSYVMIRRFPVMTVVSAVIVMVFGGLTIWLHNDTFIKMKPTIIYALFAGVLGIGLLMKKPLLATVFDAMFHLTDEGWHKLTIRWALFFVFMAVLNEIVWRTQTTDFWVAFKLFGAIPITFVFAMLQYPLMTKHDASGEKKAEG